MNSLFSYKKLFSIIFIVCIFSIILFLFYSVFIIGQKNISIEENRALQKVPNFTFSSFCNGNYQIKMENSIADQIVLSTDMKYVIKTIENSLIKYCSNICKVNDSDEDNIITKINEEQSLSYNKIQIDKNQYIYEEVVSNKVYKLDDSGYLVEKPHAPEEYIFDLYKPEMLEKVTFPKYLFFIQTPESSDFNDLYKYKTLDYIKTQMKMTDYAELSYNSFEEYKQYFYQTDHHWNFYGSYLGYIKIIQLLEGQDVEYVKPMGEHVYNAIFEGSYARINLLRCATQKFKVYLFDLPHYKTYVNNKEKEYDYRSWYVSDDDFPHKIYTNHYGLYYGDDVPKVVYDYNQPGKESILILGTSYTNAINELIASHYNQTHILDYRYYKDWAGYDIDIQSYMIKYNLSKVIIIGNISSLGRRIEE